VLSYVPSDPLGRATLTTVRNRLRSGVDTVEGRQYALSSLAAIATPRAQAALRPGLSGSRRQAGIEKAAR
jgi:hypothetical protein